MHDTRQAYRNLAAAVREKCRDAHARAKFAYDETVKKQALSTKNHRALLEAEHKKAMLRNKQKARPSDENTVAIDRTDTKISVDNDEKNVATLFLKNWRETLILLRVETKKC